MDLELSLSDQKYQCVNVNMLPKIYIIKKLLSTAKPDIKRDKENIGTVVENTVAPFPINPITFANTNTGNRPMLSAKAPNSCVPNTDPTKNID